MLQEHFFDFLSKTFGKRENLEYCFEGKQRRAFHHRMADGGFYSLAKLVLFRLLVLIVRDSVITLSEIAYNQKVKEGHSKKRLVFVITNKKFILS